MSIHPCIECDNEVSPCQQALQCDDYGRSYGLSDHMIDFCVVSLHGFVRNQEKVSQAYEMSVSKKRVHTKRTTLHFFVRNGERFPLLLETNNALRIFMVLSETKSASVIKISQRYCLLTVWNSDLFSIYFFGRLAIFFITKISGNMTQVSGDLTVNPICQWHFTVLCMRLWPNSTEHLHF